MMTCHQYFDDVDDDDIILRSSIDISMRYQYEYQHAISISACDISIVHQRDISISDISAASILRSSIDISMRYQYQHAISISACDISISEISPRQQQQQLCITMRCCCSFAEHIAYVDEMRDACNVSARSICKHHNREYYEKE